MVLFVDLLDEIPRHLRTHNFFIFLAAKITIERAWKSAVVNVALVKQTSLDHGQ